MVPRGIPDQNYRAVMKSRPCGFVDGQVPVLVTFRADWPSVEIEKVDRLREGLEEFCRFLCNQRDVSRGPLSQSRHSVVGASPTRE